MNSTDASDNDEKKIQDPGASAGSYRFRLFISGRNMRSQRAIANMKRLCDEVFEGSAKLEVVDVFQQPDLARKNQVIAVPTVVRVKPGPLRRVIGDLSDREAVLRGLELPEE